MTLALTPQSFPTAGELERIQVATITGYVVEVTPAVAAEWLHANTGNRIPREAHVRSLAAEISADRWRFTHQGIAFSSSGRLIDGQHRLKAVMRADKAAMMAVFIGIDDNMFGALDRGVTRSIRDELMIGSNYVDPCTLLARLLLDGDRHKATPADVKRIMDAFSNELKAVNTTFGGTARGRTAAGLKAALMLRLAQCTAQQWTMLLAQWHAFATLDTLKMDQTTASILKRLDSLGMDKGSSTATERLAIGWIGWEPKKRDLGRIAIRDISEVLHEIRGEIRGRLPEVDEAAASDPSSLAAE